MTAEKLETKNPNETPKENQTAEVLQHDDGHIVEELENEETPNPSPNQSQNTPVKEQHSEKHRGTDKQLSATKDGELVVLTEKREATENIPNNEAVEAKEALMQIETVEEPRSL